MSELDYRSRVGYIPPGRDGRCRNFGFLYPAGRGNVGFRKALSVQIRAFGIYGKYLQGFDMQQVAGTDNKPSAVCKGAV